jgi:hypothetical protein
VALQLIKQAATRQPEPALPGLRLKMGELLISCGSHGPVALCHTNCLLSLEATTDSRSQVGSYYAEAAGDKRLEILNPVQYDQQLMSHIPPAYRFRGYGYGCGSGVECFIAARLVGNRWHSDRY